MRNIIVIRYNHITLANLTLLSYQVQGKYVTLSGYPSISVDRELNALNYYKSKQLHIQYFNDVSTYYYANIISLDHTSRTIRIRLEITPLIQHQNILKKLIKWAKGVNTKFLRNRINVG